MIDVCVHDDSMTSLRFTTRTEQLTKCGESLQKLRVRLWPCKIDLSPQVILYYRSFKGNISAVVLIVFFVMALNFCAVYSLCTFS